MIDTGAVIGVVVWIVLVVLVWIDEVRRERRRDDGVDDLATRRARELARDA